MAKRRFRKKSSRFNELLKLLGVVGVVVVVIWYWREKNPPQPASSKNLLSAAAQKALPEEKEKTSEETSEKKSSKSLTSLFPKEAWTDDYLQIPAALDEADRNDLLIALGLAPQGKDPNQISNPDQLRPALMVVKKEGDQLTHRDLFDFSTPGATEAGIRGADLRGIPRITPQSLLDLGRDGKKEIVVSLDTAGEFSQAIAFLKWEGSKLQWIKTKNRSGQEKIALWLSGATQSESEEVTTRKAEGREMIEVIHKRGVLDPREPQKGFVWTTTYWQMKDGFLVEK